MTFDKELVKERVSLRDLFERDGHVFKKAGSDDWACRCPVHDEKTSSCHVHEEKGFFKCFGCDFKGDAFVYWQQTRGVDFKAALEALAVIAGVSGANGEWQNTNVKVKAPKPEPVAELAPAMSGKDRARWLEGVDELLRNQEQRQRIAGWRGLSEETIRWAAERGLMGWVRYGDEMREGFIVERPHEDGSMLPVGYHVRLAPGSSGNDDLEKASWRYQPSSKELGYPLGSWPFVMGDVATAKVIFCMEGQWDALALVDLMEWAVVKDVVGEGGSVVAKAVGSVPPGVAIVGMRGATSWKLFLKHYSWPNAVTVFAVADADNAGRTWFAKDGLVDQLRPRCRRVWGFFPKAGDLNGVACKDFNDLHKARLITREQLRVMLRGKLRRPGKSGKGAKGGKPKGDTFLKWCRKAANERADLVGQAAFMVVRDKKRPKGRKSLKVWERHWSATMTNEQLPALRAAWDEWRKAA